MDIKSQPRATQEKWLQQRGWVLRSQGVWIDPDNRMPFAFPVAVDRALSECRIASDFELKPESPPRKDDAPFPLPEK
jgi:hypothetical protein